MLKNDLMILTVGGTIDKSYGRGLGVRDLSFAGDPAVREILHNVQSYNEYPIVQLMTKDSLDMDDHDRKVVADMCRGSPAKRLLITHGTDTMIKTAGAIAKLRLKKTIVLTAAGQPAMAKGSDADFNVGFALSAALLGAPGVYVSMNAMLYRHDKCRKNAAGIFEPI